MSSIIDTRGKELLELPAIKEKWDGFKEAFGDDIVLLFGDDYPKKLRFAATLTHLQNGDLHSALKGLKKHEMDFVSDLDKRFYATFTALCEALARLDKVKAGDWVKDEIFGFWQVLEKTDTHAVIKHAFKEDMRFIYGLYPTAYSRICLSDLTGFRLASRTEVKAIEHFFKANEASAKSFYAQTERYLAYREQLLAAGFQEARLDQGKFLLRATKKTAFFINLSDVGHGIYALYGYISTACMKGEESYFDDHGADRDFANLRFETLISSPETEKNAKDHISEIFGTYRSTDKDTLLAIATEKRKAFLDRINDRLRSLGFKRKGNSWKKPDGNGVTTELYAHKRFCDCYYFDLIRIEDKSGRHIASARLSARPETRNSSNTSINWQLISDAELDSILSLWIETYLIT